LKQKSRAKPRNPLGEGRSSRPRAPARRPTGTPTLGRANLRSELPGGARLPSFDGRDEIYGFPSSITLGPRRRLRHGVPVRDQGRLLCCVSIAITSCMEILDAARGDVCELSPLYHYYTALDGGAPADIEPRVGLRVAARAGVCAREHHDMAFDDDGVGTAPSITARDDALTRRLWDRDDSTRYQLITTDRAALARTAIARGYPVFVAFHVTSAYRALADGRFVHGVPDAESTNTGHAVVAVGYDDANATFLIEDSRGTSFGRAGHWLMPYAMLDSRFVHEAWVLRRITYDA
jgi:hypothetical protein